MFNPDMIAAVKAAKFCWVVVYPAVRGESRERVLLEVANEITVFGHTDYQCGAGHWLVSDRMSVCLAQELFSLVAGLWASHYHLNH